MSRRISRRELLAGITAAGAAGTLSGVGTAALLVDRETLAASATSGRVDLQIDTGDGPVDAMSSPIELDLPALEAGAGGSTTLSLLVPDTSGSNPAYLWLRAGCGLETTLGPHLRLSVSRTDGAGGHLFEGTLTEFFAVFAAGVPLDSSGDTVAVGHQDCVQPGSTLELLIEYELSPAYVGAETLSILLEAAAVQCRHVSPTTRPPEFGAALGRSDCVPDCPCCPLIGKYEVVNDTLGSGSYRFTEGSSAYQLTVSNVETNGDGEPVAAEFGVIPADGTSDPLDVCVVHVKSATDVFTYRDEETDSAVGTTGKSISHVTVGICSVEVFVDDGRRCPEDLISDPSLGTPGNGGGGDNGNSNDDGNNNGSGGGQ
jgi:hypothetical protein